MEKEIEQTLSLIYNFCNYFRLIYGKASGRLLGHAQYRILKDEILHFVCLLRLFAHSFIMCSQIIFHLYCFFENNINSNSNSILYQKYVFFRSTMSHNAFFLDQQCHIMRLQNLWKFSHNTTSSFYNPFSFFRKRNQLSKSNYLCIKMHQILDTVKIFSTWWIKRNAWFFET